MPSLHGQWFSTDEDAHAMLERYNGDLCCSDKRETYRIVEEPA